MNNKPTLPPFQEETDFPELWLAETERRDTEMESGQVVGILGEEVFRRIRARYRIKGTNQRGQL